MYLPWRGSHLAGGAGGRGGQAGGQNTAVVLLLLLLLKSLPNSSQPPTPTAPVPLPTHLAIMEEGSKAELVISATDSCSW